MKKKLFAALMAAGMLLTLTACGSKDSGGKLLDEIKERGELIVGTEGTWSPWTFHNESGELVGYDVEIAKAIGDKLGVKVTFVEGEFDGLLAGVDAGRYDMVANGVTVDEDRSEKYDFSVTYAYNRTAVIVAGESDIKKMEDLNGKQTANTITSVYAKVAEKYGATVTGVDDLNQTFELLLAGRINATLNDEVAYYDYMKEHPDADLHIACFDYEMTEAAIPMPKGETALVEAVNKALNEMAEDGTLSALSIKYMGSDISKID